MLEIRVLSWVLYRDVVQFGSTLDLGSRGCGFKSRHSDLGDIGIRVKEELDSRVSVEATLLRNSASEVEILRPSRNKTICRWIIPLVL